jgi:hypothetical protein
VRLELHPEARAELRSAALWYDEQRPGLGDEFIADVSATLDRIGGTPESYPAWPRTRAAGPLIRKATIQRFPYVIAFEKREQHVLVLAVRSSPHVRFAAAIVAISRCTSRERAGRPGVRDAGGIRSDSWSARQRIRFKTGSSARTE